MTIDDLQAYCYTGARVRWLGICAPWFHGGWLYATDGKIAIRIPAGSGPEPLGPVPMDYLLPQFITAFSGDLTAFRPAVPDYSHTETSPCPHCGQGVMKLVSVRFGKTWINARYFNAVANQPGVMVREVAENGQLAAYFNGGQALIAECGSNVEVTCQPN